MNEDETNRIYYHCAIHNYMSGYTGDEGYMILDTSTDDDDDVNMNTYYIEDFYQPGDTSTIDRSRHVDGHSKVIGMSFDGYPIYGPWGYNSSGAVAREVSSYRLRTGNEVAGNREEIVTPSTVTYAINMLQMVSF